MYKYFTSTLLSMLVWGWATVSLATLPHSTLRPLLKSSVAIPQSFGKPNPLGKISILDANGHRHMTTLVGDLQQKISRYLSRHGNPIAAVALADVKSGHILALVQGKNPEEWGHHSHSALYEGFPAASIFKMVPATAALEESGFMANSKLEFAGGCGEVGPRAVWLRQSRRHSMSLSRAFAFSCNNFFAKLSIQHIGAYRLGEYAKNYGWERRVPADFLIPVSPAHFPDRVYSSSHNIGRFAAGFGMVGMSVLHAAWISMLVAKGGVVPSLRIFNLSSPNGLIASGHVGKRLFRSATIFELRQMMKHTVRSGTAASIFRKRKYRSLRPYVGGKTGTLISHAPGGLATWFVGLMPVEDPQVVVSAVVVNSNRWVIKGTHLAAESLSLWQRWQNEMKVAKKSDLAVKGAHSG